MTSTTHTRIRPATIAMSLAIVIGAWLALAGNAHAAGQITYDGCVANDASQGCADVPAAPLDGASGVAVSPDGKSVYASSIGSSSVSHLFRGGPDGQISYDGCLANSAAEGCFDLPADPITNARKVAVSPDGKSVYVVSDNGAVAHFFRSATGGQITYDGCVSNDGSQGCADIPGPGTPLVGANDVAVSPDGKSVYVSSGISDSVSHFFRSTTGGQISYDGCVANDASQGCADIPGPGTPLVGADGVAVSPDNQSVYVSSGISDSVSHFFRSTVGGQISYDGCVANDASQGCADIPAAPLDGPTAVVVSPDNKSVYVTSDLGDSVAHFFRSTTGGQISYDGCLANDASQGCADIPAAPLNGAAEVAVSPDGKSVYVASFFSDSVAHFFRGGPDGQISYDGCVANDASQGCADVPAAPLTGAIDIAVSPDNRSVYVSSVVSDSVSHFFRAVDPDPNPDPDQNPDPNADKSPPQTTIDKGPKRKTTRQATTIRFSADEPGSRFECKLDKGKFKPCSSPRKIKRLRPGKHRFAVRAIDQAGNADPTPAKVRWRVVR
jgi:DNA-binding beta-propeller fold protein YncE